MEININRFIEGAKNAKGITVVIDVFRASNTILSCLKSGADFVMPVGEVEDAFKLKADNQEFLLLGERGGVMVEGFDYGNSPIEVSEMDLANKKVILTTSAGSQGIVYSDKAEEVIIGCFTNAQAIIDYLRGKKPEVVTLLAIGNNARELAVEDEECAHYLKSKLEGVEVDIVKMKRNILASDGANRLRRLNQDDDLEFCLEFDVFDIVPKYNRATNTINY